MKLAVIGDIHGFWDARDTAYFNGSDYDVLLFVGDLPRFAGPRGVASEIARLSKPAWLIPGNHDGVTTRQLWAEIKNRRTMSWLCSLGMGRRVRRLERQLRPVRMTGYEVNTLSGGLGLLAARPHAMGPDRFYFRRYMRRRYGIDDYQASARLLRKLVDSAPERLILLAHNGPAGLGDTPDAPFGCDFAPEKGDFGDPDLRDALDHARASGRQVLAVVAGHMHHRNPKTGEERRTWSWDGDTLCINAANVARIRKKGNRRHHVALTVNAADLQAETVYVDADGKVLESTPIGSNKSFAP
jgi:uncharacterized protein (TIGR04168 family)